MNEADVESVEAALGYALPDHYREFIINHSHEIRQIGEKLPLRVVVYTNPEEMIADNRLPREFPDAFFIGADNRPWPENHLIVATDGAGDYWYVHRDASDLGIWVYHKWQKLERANATLHEWMEELRGDLSDLTRWQFPQGTE